MTLVSAKIPESPSATPMMAVTRGTPAMSADPKEVNSTKEMNSTKKATITPICSPAPVSPSFVLTTPPENSTCRPAARRLGNALEGLLRRVLELLDRDGEVKVGEADRLVARGGEAPDELLASRHRLRHLVSALDRRVYDLLVLRLVEGVSLRGREDDPRSRTAGAGEFSSSRSGPAATRCEAR
jgi:hypothetical protein